ncbi:MAG: thymidine phosphorylase [Marinosulfonomonas sp.]|nr:thymidine phosphorylase [Marinosulfonomonas sp.]
MDARGIIAKLRDKKSLSSAEINWFANGLADGQVSDAQGGAFAMAAFLNKLSTDERVALTLAMRDSGDVLKWDLPGPVIDKHSTGGIGDCVSLLLAPALAALGAYVPMVSGRGLGHTGGTLDKLEAIPGLKTEVSQERFHQIVSNVGTAIVSATGRIAPADKRLYAIRDVTGTVESIDLITASILSKKLAAGLDSLVLDVKVGSGAFMKTMDDAAELAQSLVSTANDAGCKTSALITDMNQPCAGSVGNALEVMEVMKVFSGQDVRSILAEVTCALGGELLVLAGMAKDAKQGAVQIGDTFSDGSAGERFSRMVVELGGPGDFVERWRDRLPAAPVIQDVFLPDEGYVAEIDGEALGLAVVRLGGGRLKGGDRIDPAVGLSEVALIGDPVGPKNPIAKIHAPSQEAAQAAITAVQRAYSLGNKQSELPPVIYRSVR